MAARPLDGGRVGAVFFLALILNLLMDTAWLALQLAWRKVAFTHRIRFATRSRARTAQWKWRPGPKESLCSFDGVCCSGSLCLGSRVPRRRTATGGIQGRLSESITYRPIADAEIQLLRGAVVQKSTRSDAGGAYVFTEVPEGVYRLTILHPGYLPAVQPEVRVVLRRISAVDLVLVRGRDETLAEVMVTSIDSSCWAYTALKNPGARWRMRCNRRTTRTLACNPPSRTAPCSASPGDGPRASSFVCAMRFSIAAARRAMWQAKRIRIWLGNDPTPENTPVREEIVDLREEETEIGWRGDINVVTPSGGILTAGTLVSRVDLEFERRLVDDWIRYVYDANDFREGPAQRYIVLTPAEFDSRLSASATRLAAYADYTWNIGDYSITPGVRYDQDGFSDESMVSPRLMLNWRPDAATHVWIGGGVYYQAPRYLDLAADALNIGLQHERSNQIVAGVSRYLASDLRFSAEAYHQQLDDLIVTDDRTTGLARNIGEGTGSGIDLLLSKRMTDTWSASATYSYSRARRDDNLGEGEYDADWDRPHAFGVVAAWQPNDRWSFAAKWRYASGRPTDAYVTHTDVLADAGGPLRYSKEIVDTNSERMPAYHALTLRADYRRRFGPLSLIAFLDVINVYGRKNGNPEFATVAPVHIGATLTLLSKTFIYLAIVPTSG